MAPIIEETDAASWEIAHHNKLTAPQAGPWKYEIITNRIFVFGYFHLAALYGLYIFFTYAKWQTIVLGIFFYYASEIGATAGAHRLWSHKAYKAKLPLQIILMIFNCISCQYTVTNWARDHRMHHKFTDTDADPHNATRGFFFSHIGWVLVKKHPEVKKRGKVIDMTDIYNNPVLKFQEKYAFVLISTLCFILPTVIPVYFWNENFNNAYHMNMLRFVLSFNAIFTINSAAHIWGYKSYDKNILASQNLAVSVVTLGEGFHNYHHTFPWDYRAGELGNNALNISALFIDFFAWIGWAYDLKTVSEDVIRSRVARTGDGTNLWGGVNKT